MPKGDPAGYLPNVKRSRMRKTGISVPPAMAKKGTPPATSLTNMRHFGTAPSSTPRGYKTRKRRGV